MLRRVDCDGVAGVDAGAFDLFHDAGDADVIAIGNGIDFDFTADHVLVDEDRMLVGSDDGFFQVLAQFCLIVNDLHRAAAKDVARADDERVFQLFCLCHCFFDGLDEAALRARDTELSHQGVEAFAVFGHIDGFIRRTDDADAALGHRGRQVDGGLSAELADDAFRFFLVNDFEDVLLGQWFEVERVGGIEVGGNGFRVVVDDDGFLSCLAQCPGGMDGAVVEFDALTDADRAGAEDDDRALALRLHFVFCAVGGVVVRGVRFKFCRTGIDHLEVRMEIQFLLEVFDVFRGNFGEVCNGFVRHLDAFRRFQCLFGEAFLHEAAFHLDDVLDLVDKEEVDLGDAVDLFRFDAAAKGFGKDEDPFVIDAGEQAADIIEGLSVEFFQVQVAFPDFQRAEGFQERAFERAVERHDFAGRFHLGADGTICEGEFFEWPAREFAYDIVDGWFEAGFRIAGDGIGDLIEVQAEGDLRCDFCDRVAGGFRCERGGTADTRIDFDNIVLVRLGVKTVLDIAAAFDLEVADDIKRCGTEHLVLAIGQRLCRSDNDGVAGMDTDRIDIFHGADDDAVVRTVAHDFEFDFFPTGNAALYEDLINRGQLDATVRDLFHFVAVMCDAAAGAA